MLMLLADDERMVREGIKSMLMELYEDKITFIEAKNGIQLIEMSEIYKPHAAFVDINMPLLNGLDAISICNEKTPQTQYVVLTGYADFELSKRALKLGVNDYLLKPVSITELEEVMQKLFLKLEEVIERERRVFALNVISTYNLSSNLGLNYLENNGNTECNFNDELIDLYVFYIDNIDEEVRMCSHNLISNSLGKILTDKRLEYFHYSFFYLNTGEICLAIIHSENSFKLVNQIKESINGVLSAITAIYKKGILISEIYSNCQEITEISAIRFILGINNVICFDQIYLISEFELSLEFSKQIEHLCIYLSEGNEVYFKSIFNLLKSKQIFSKVLFAENLKKYLSLIGLNIEFYDYTSFLGALSNILGEISFYQKNINKNLISQIEKYIEKNYMNDISLKLLSEIFNITPNYLSRIFHEKSGKKFIDYLTEFRIIRAKELLSEKNKITIKEVAQSVGYYSIRHFTKVFHKYTGYLPSEYKSKH